MEFTLEQKIGQMILAGFRGTEINADSPIANDLKNNFLGSVWIVDNDSPMMKTVGNIESSNQLKKLTNDLQNFARNSLLTSIDIEGGEVVRLKEKYGFPKIPSAKYFGDKDNPLLTRRNADLIASLMKEHGLNLNLAPVVDLNINAESPVIGMRGRSFSSDPEKVFVHAREFILAHREKNIATCLKHYPGHGSSIGDTHDGFVDVTRQWSEIELRPYELLLDEKLVDSVMVAHVFNNRLDENYPASLSKYTITGLLREKLGFEGVVITDDLNMKAIDDNYTPEIAIELALNAGADIIVRGNVRNYDPNIVSITIEIIKKLVEENKISEKRIDESFGRIVNLKRKLNLNILR